MRTLAIITLALLAGLSSVGDAQVPGKHARIGRLSPQSAEADAPLLDAFRKGLRELGWVEGKHYSIEGRFAEGKLSLLPKLASELVERDVDVLLVGSIPGTMAAKNATRSIPIVMVATGDPIGAKLIDSLPRPGGNITGVTSLGHALTAKRLELLKELAPALTRVAVLTSPGSFNPSQSMDESSDAPRKLKLQLQIVEAHGAAQLDQAFAEMSRAGAEALLVTDVGLRTHRKQIVELAAKMRLPAIYDEREFVDVGGLIFYGANLPDMYKHAATHVDKILKGAKPGDLAVELPKNFEMIINPKTASALGITFPRTILLRADSKVD